MGSLETSATILHSILQHSSKGKTVKKLSFGNRDKI